MVDIGGAEALARCVGDVGRFLTESWGRRAHLRTGADVAGLLGVDDVDHILGSMALRAPAFRLVKGGATLDTASYTRRARIGSRTITDLIDVAAVYFHFGEGATIVLQGLHRYWPPVRELCGDLEQQLTHPVQANAYITPPVAQGLRVHADQHDVFALQTYGRKQWVVYEDGREPDADGVEPAPTFDGELTPGDCLYLPKGMAHAARTVDSTSIHLTVGIRALTWADVLRPVMEDALGEAVLDEALPAGFAHRADVLVDEAARRFEAAADRLREADAGAGLQRAARRFWAGRTPVLTGQFPQLLALSEVGDDTHVRRRAGARAEVTRRGDRMSLELADRTLRMPAAAEPALRHALELGTLRVADLRDHLDEQGRVTLVRRLIREGLFTVVDG